MRILVRLILGGSVLLALAAMGVSLFRLGLAEATAWATVAAALAVIAAVASAWTGQRVLELQEDAQEPDPVPMLDCRSRYGLTQFRIRNHGGEAAHQVKIVWKDQLRDAEGKEVLLGRDVAVPVIPRGESASVSLGGSIAFFAKNQNTTCKGTVSFENVSGRKYVKPFVLSGEHERQALFYDSEEGKALRELQRIPSELQAVERAIRSASR